MTEIYNKIKAAQNGDGTIRSELVENNVGLVWSVAKKFYGRGHEPDDLFQMGTIGLLKAIDKFNPEFGVQFSTYAVPMIMGEIKRFLRDDGIIKVSRSLKELVARAARAREALSGKLNREPTVNEIAKEIDAEVEELVAAMDACAAPDSLFAEHGETESSLIETTAAEGDFADDVTRTLAIKQALAGLKSRERQVIVLRYFAEKTQTQIGELLGISQVQVSRIESKVLAKIRESWSG